MDNPVAHLRNGRKWAFKWQRHAKHGTGWYYLTRENVYRIFVDEAPERAGFDLWVGRLSADRRTWYTVEARLGIRYIEWFRGRVVFKPGRA